jgi:hypothetical protein
VIQQAVASDFQLRPGAEACTAFFRNVYGLDDSLAVALPVHDPLVQTACRYSEEAAHVEVVGYVDAQQGSLHIS